jgi:ABC-type multidrug transport system fused ATPase/permease subunit
VPLQDGTIRSWQMNIGYVPQNIYLSNDSISGNIAFGVAKKKINMEAVVRAAKLAQLHDFIEAELKDGYDTKIGERGIRLSGGQRQRIGIARALYREPSVLIMDEATSSLDSQTERAVMEAIDALQGSRTIILIAHRLTTLKQCDVIHLMEKGRIVDSGKYQELLHKNRFFSG